MSNDKKIRVLVLSHTGELLGGAERSMLDVFDYLSKNHNVEPEFIVREPLKTLAGALNERRWKYYPLSYTFWSDGRPPEHPDQIIRNAAANAHAVVEIRNIIRATKPDIVMTNTIVCPWAAIAANYERVPHMWFAREYGDLDHGRIFEIGRENTWQDIGSLSDVVVTISQSIADHIRKYVPKEKVVILYNPFKLDDIALKTKEDVTSPYTSKNSLKIVIAGNMAPSKGQLEAIKAVAELKKRGHDAEVCIIGREGEKDFMNEISHVISESSLEKKVHMVGFQKNPLAYVAAADVCIMASKKEAFGRVTFEYLVAGKPIVGANSGATPEMVIHGKNGYLYDVESITSLTDALENYCIDRSLLKKHGEYSSDHAKKMMSGEHNITRLYDRIKSVATKPTTTPQPINYSLRWMEYADIANQAFRNAQIFSVKRMIKIRTRQKVKSVYVRAHNAKSKLTRKSKNEK